MVSKNQIKLITSLQQKKYRIANKLFFAEGVKGIEELLDSNFELEHLFTTQNDFDSVSQEKKTIISENDLKKVTALATPNTCLAVFKMPVEKSITETGLILALDSIRDPGNLGTILRLCDWFGIQQVLCSKETVDLYNPKVVQATMGSIARVNVNYVDLNVFLAQTKLPIFGTFMDGENIYKATLPQQGIIIMGNEANGISPALENEVHNRLTIPRFGNLQKTESLNVAAATAIVLSEFCRG
ncbi:RNA methyltransferase [Flavobacterium sp. LS1P28]|uniref:RNA methyltransferase n=1 Tax=Flavobacterium bomense TaxID=2497483 RepID=A0A432CLW6_9FLAO|nr:MULTISPECIES: RNA methyltransferase [Flavobacterium]RTY65861.1 RNA methyltransferase [Flavobacterium sp. LB2P53]RTY75990.1 RNA methyltransferase [Flavobacterium sp. LS1R10]RTY80946.1 RNA methyltransferase [Flavobacterium sp. LS1P28]RTY89771.1 RNA methyltransferase [Flavobacterium sp. RSP46]RTZ04320.1 RNA methyltransferase [Flavobacterium bomense]